MVAWAGPIITTHGGWAVSYCVLRNGPAHLPTTPNAFCKAEYRVCSGREAVNHDKDAMRSLIEFNRPPRPFIIHLPSPGINLGTNGAKVIYGIATRNTSQ